MSARLKTPVDEDLLYPSSDGQPMGETPRHVRNMRYALEPLDTWFADDDWVLVAGIMFVYYVEGNPRKHVSPDILVSKGVPKETAPEREKYLLWREGKPPDAIIEFTSKSTRREDTVTKKAIYQDKLKVPEYFLFDPWDDYLDPRLQGYRLTRGKYRSIELQDGRLWSETLGLFLETQGELLRFVDPGTGVRLPIPPEIAAAHIEAEEARMAAEKELARLRREIEELKKRQPKSNGRR